MAFLVLWTSNGAFVLELNYPPAHCRGGYFFFLDKKETKLSAAISWALIKNKQHANKIKPAEILLCALGLFSTITKSCGGGIFLPGIPFQLNTPLGKNFLCPRPPLRAGSFLCFYPRLICWQETIWFVGRTWVFFQKLGSIVIDYHWFNFDKI